MMETGMAPWWMVPAALSGVLVTKAWDWWLGRRLDKAERVASAELVEGLNRRIQDLEARQAVLDQRLSEEVKLRLSSQEQTLLLRVRVQILEREIVKLGGEVPAPLVAVA